MRLYVSATMYYGYEIEVSEEKLKELTEGYGKTLVDYASEMDPLEPHGVNLSNCEWYINSIFDAKGDDYYIG